MLSKTSEYLIDVVKSVSLLDAFYCDLVTFETIKNCFAKKSFESFNEPSIRI